MAGTSQTSVTTNGVESDRSWQYQAVAEGNMKVLLRDAQHSDIPFLRTMLYEAVFWRASASKPSFEEGLAYPEVRKALADWGEKDGDTAVVATTDTISVGAAWYRFWTEDDFDRGYVDADTPVLAIGVHPDHRHQGIGKSMMGWLIDHASRNGIQRISLSVSKDNYAINLYRQQGFVEYADIGDSFLMVRDIKVRDIGPAHGQTKGRRAAH